MNNLWDGQWKPSQKKFEFLPVKVAFVVSAVQPSLPSTHYLPSKLLKRSNVSCNTIVGEMTSHLFTKLLPLLANRFMPIPATPLGNPLETASKPSPVQFEGHRLAFDRPVALLSFTPIVRKTE